MDIQQFEQIYDELGRLEKKQFAQYINDNVVNLHEVNDPYDEKNPLTKSELLDLLKNRKDAIESIVSEDIDEAKRWLERILMS